MHLFTCYHFFNCMGSNNKLYYTNPIQQLLFEEDDDGKLIVFKE